MIPSLMKVVVLIGIVSYGSHVVAAGATRTEKDLTYSSSEQTALEQFKERVLHRLPDNYMRTDFYLIRWLRVKT